MGATAQERSDALRRQQDALAAYIRDPEHVAPPPGIEERRLAIYRELFFNNVEGLLAGNFPVIRKILGEAGWRTLVRAFYREHGSRTPLFTELAREFLRYLDTRPADVSEPLPPWLAELAHYEWVELALQISEAREDDLAHDPHGDLLAAPPVPSPLAWPLAYAWPVHRLSPAFLPDAPPAQPTLLLVHRERTGKVRFHELTPLSWRLLQRLDEAPDLSGRAQLAALAAEAGHADPDALLQDGGAMLQRFRADGIVLGTRLPSSSSAPPTLR